MRLIVVILSMLATMAMAAAPAAATDPPAVGVSFPDTILPADSVGITIRVAMDTLGQAADFQFTIDLSDLVGVATVDVSWEPGCTGTATTITCSGLEPPSIGFPLTIVPVTGAEPGSNGRLTVRAVALNRSPGSHTATVTIGEGVDLASILVPATSTAPGGQAPAPLTIRNVGSVAVRGVVVLLPARVAGRPSNCDFSAALRTDCHFDTVLAAGVTYEVVGLEILVPSDVSPPRGAGFNLQWLTPADYAHQHDARPPMFGTGPSLDLQPVPGSAKDSPAAASTAAAPPQTDRQPDNNRGSFDIEVLGPNVADFAAVGTTVSAAVGEIVTMRIGVSNLGPVTVEVPFSSVGSISFTLPAGVTVLTPLPFFCGPNYIDGYFDGYGCPIQRSLAAGHTMMFEFQIRVDRPLTNAIGTLAVANRSNAPDNNATNDTATIVVNSTGGLPVTGTRTGPIAAAGATLLTLGALVYALGRRRRTRC